MVLSAAAPRTFGGSPSLVRSKVAASATIYKGAGLQTDAVGLVAPLVAATDLFAGFAMEDCDNSAGAAGAKAIQVAQTGVIRGIVVVGSSAGAVGADVYMSADDTFTLTSTSNTLIGRLQKQAAASSTTWDVSFEAKSVRSPA